MNHNEEKPDSINNNQTGENLVTNSCANKNMTLKTCQDDPMWRERQEIHIQCRTPTSMPTYAGGIRGFSFNHSIIFKSCFARKTIW